MANEVAVVRNKDLSAVESALVKNDISKLGVGERISYINALCDSVGLNPLTQPFAILSMQGKEVLYARKDCTEQLRKIHGVSTEIRSQGIVGDFYEVHIKAKDKTGREDEDFASIPLGSLKGADLSNLKMKCVTKAKRRVTLSICGLGMLDESELDTIHPSAIKPAENPQIVNPFSKEDAPPEHELVEVINEDENLGNFVCKIGKKFNGKKLSEIDMFELNNYLEWLNKSAAEKNKPLTGDFLEFARVTEAYLSTLEVSKEELK